MSASPGLLARLSSEGRTPDEIREAAYVFGEGAAAKQSRFWLLLVLSAAIASAGIIADSTATVIGAMIIAPLAIPIQGIAVAIAYGEPEPLLKSLAVLLAAVVAVIAIAAGLAALLPDLKPASENVQITGRVSPTIVDLVAAAATGLAGSFAIARRDIGDILPGVAIAISLVPPLAVVGVTGSTADFDGALGALLLFVTNVLAILVAGIVIFGATRLWEEEEERFHRRSILAVVAAGCAVVVAALGVSTFRAVALANQLDDAREIASEWASGRDERLVDAHFEGSSLVLVVEGPEGSKGYAQLSSLLDPAVPDGTKLIVNRINGSRQEVGVVG